MAIIAGRFARTNGRLVLREAKRELVSLATRRSLCQWLGASSQLRSQRRTLCQTVPCFLSLLGTLETMEKPIACVQPLTQASPLTKENTKYNYSRSQSHAFQFDLKVSPGGFSILKYLYTDQNRKGGREVLF